MKRSLITWLLIAAAALIGIIAAGFWINGQQDDITIKETVLYGNKATAEGVEFTYKNAWRQKLNWTTDYTIGEKPHIRSTFKLAHLNKRYSGEAVQFTANSKLNGNVTRPSGIYMRNHTLGKKLLEDTASRTKPGETHMERVLLKDYFDTIPLEAFITGQLSSGSTINSIADKNDRDVYFRIDVPDDMTVEISLTKDKKGNITEYEILDFLDFTGISSATKEGVYLAVSRATYLSAEPGKIKRMGYAELGETSDLPLGKYNGVHYIPFIGDDNLKNSLVPDWKHAKRSFAGTKESRFIALSESPDARDLFILSAQGKKLFLTVMDKGTSAEKQTLRLYDKGEYTENAIFLYDENAVLVLGSDHTFSLLTKEDGKYRRSFAGALGKYMPDAYLSSFEDYTMDFDRETGDLALGAVNHSEYIDSDLGIDYIDSSTALIAVFRSGKMTYAGRYQIAAKNSPHYELISFGIKAPLTVLLPKSGS